VIGVVEAMRTHVLSNELVVSVEYPDRVEHVQEDRLRAIGCVFPLHYWLVAEVAGDKMLF